MSDIIFQVGKVAQPSKMKHFIFVNLSIICAAHLLHLGLFQTFTCLLYFFHYFSYVSIHVRDIKEKHPQQFIFLRLSWFLNKYNLCNPEDPIEKY